MKILLRLDGNHLFPVGHITFRRFEWNRTLITVWWPLTTHHWELNVVFGREKRVMSTAWSMIHFKLKYCSFAVEYFWFSFFGCSLIFESYLQCQTLKADIIRDEIDLLSQSVQLSSTANKVENEKKISLQWKWKIIIVVAWAVSSEQSNTDRNYYLFLYVSCIVLFRMICVVISNNTFHGRADNE